MNRKQYQKRKKLRKRKMKRLMIAYLLRAVVILIPIIMMILMVCGCLYIYERFTKEDEKVNKYTDIYTDRNAGNDAAPVASTENNAPGFCVVVDAGHGGIDGGTVSGKAVEKDINLSVAWKLKAILENDNIEVILTRSSDEKIGRAHV